VAKARGLGGRPVGLAAAEAAVLRYQANRIYPTTPQASQGRLPARSVATFRSHKRG